MTVREEGKRETEENAIELVIEERKRKLKELAQDRTNCRL